VVVEDAAAVEVIEAAIEEDLVEEAVVVQWKPKSSVMVAPFPRQTLM